MDPTLRIGQFVLVNRWVLVKVGDLIVANDTQRDIKVIKRITKEVGRGKWKVESDNEGHGKPRVVTRDQIIGKVIRY